MAKIYSLISMVTPNSPREALVERLHEVKRSPRTKMLQSALVMPGLFRGVKYRGMTDHSAADCLVIAKAFMTATRFLATIRERRKRKHGMAASTAALNNASQKTKIKSIVATNESVSWCLDRLHGSKEGHKLSPLLCN